jgi:hypothetical protein
MICPAYRELIKALVSQIALPTSLGRSLTFTHTIYSSSNACASSTQNRILQLYPSSHRKSPCLPAPKKSSSQCRRIWPTTPPSRSSPNSQYDILNVIYERRISGLTQGPDIQAHHGRRIPSPRRRGTKSLDARWRMHRRLLGRIRLLRVLQGSVRLLLLEEKGYTTKIPGEHD